MTTYPITITEAAAWFIATFGQDLPEGQKWLWIEGVLYVEDIPKFSYLIARCDGLQGIIREGDLSCP